MTQILHTNEDSFLCIQCDNSNTSNIYLEQHMMIDTIDAQFQRQHCDRSSFSLFFSQYQTAGFLHIFIGFQN